MFKVTFEAFFNSEEDYRMAKKGVEARSFKSDSVKIIDRYSVDYLYEEKELTGNIIFGNGDYFKNTFKDSYGILKKCSCYNIPGGGYANEDKECFYINKYEYSAIYEKNSNETKTLMKKVFEANNTTVFELVSTNVDDIYALQDITEEYRAQYSKLDLGIYFGQLARSKSEKEKFTDKEINAIIESVKKSISTSSEYFNALSLFMTKIETFGKHMSNNQLIKIFSSLTEKVTYKKIFKESELIDGALSNDYKLMLLFFKHVLELNDDVYNKVLKLLKEIDNETEKTIKHSNYGSNRENICLNFYESGKSVSYSFNVLEFLNYQEFKTKENNEDIFPKMDIETTTTEDIIARALAIFIASYNINRYYYFPRRELLRSSIYAAMLNIQERNLDDDTYKKEIQLISKTLGRIIGLDDIFDLVLGHYGLGNYYYAYNNKYKELQERKYNDLKPEKIKNKDRYIPVDIVICVANFDDRRGNKAFENILSVCKNSSSQNKKLLYENCSESSKYFNFEKLRKFIFNYNLK